jgi:putative spermidine/putrescine transport system ATP-binding protein
VSGEGAHLELGGVTLRYPGAGRPAVSGLSLALARGEVLALLGPSGCGKSTTLRIAAGLEHPDSGSVRLDGADVTGWPPERRRMGVVFQSYALFPHLDVAGNVAFGPRVRGAGRAEVAAAVRGALELVRMSEFGGRPVDQLSGGQQQRVALARAIASDPAVLLLDEPLSNLDASLREETRETLRAMLRRLGKTALFVTHDQADALAFADRVAVMRDGEVVEVGPPEALYREPDRAFTATFLGAANVLDAVAAGDGATVELSGGGAAVPLRAGSAGAGVDLTRRGLGVVVVIRPEAVELVAAGTAGAADAAVVDSVFLGPATRALLRLETGHELRALVPVGPRSERVGVLLPPAAVRALRPETP